MTEKEQQFERIYEETKDFGRTQFVREIQMQINDNKKKDKKIKELQKKAELGEHYKHLYSEVKKQKDDVVENAKEKIKRYESYIHDLKNGNYPSPTVRQERQELIFRIREQEDLLRMLGEKDD